MFWKKRSKGEPESQRSTPPADSRQAYRVAPSEEAPITLFTGGNSYEVLDISSGGLSLTSDDLNVGDDLDVEFNLPMGIELTAERISIRLKVLRRGRNNIYHCRFLDISPEKEDKIHKYVLERQKEELRF